jgi:hypothetical protein
VIGAEALNAKRESIGVEAPVELLRRISIVADPSPKNVMLPRFASALSPTKGAWGVTTTTGAGNVDHVPAGNDSV